MKTKSSPHILHNQSTNNAVPGKKTRSKVENKLVMAITLVFLRNQNVVQSNEKNDFSYMQKGEQLINTVQRSVKIENVS